MKEPDAIQAVCGADPEAPGGKGPETHLEQFGRIFELTVIKDRSTGCTRVRGQARLERLQEWAGRLGGAGQAGGMECGRG